VFCKQEFVRFSITKMRKEIKAISREINITAEKLPMSCDFPGFFFRLRASCAESVEELLEGA